MIKHGPLRHTVNKYKEIIGILWVFYQLPGSPSAPRIYKGRIDGDSYYTM